MTTLLDVVVGVDGGGSKTLALAADLSGQSVGMGQAGPSNYQAVGLAAATQALEEAIAQALAGAGDAARLRSLCLGLAGVGRPADRAAFETWAAAAYPQCVRLVTTDAHLLLAAGTPEGWGVAVISGTGSLVYGRDAAGNTARAGGWGYLLGDEGSGYALGLAGLRAVARAADGRGPQTALTAALLAEWGLDEPQALIARVYRLPVARAEVAALAQPVLAAAAQGDAVAGAIVAEAGRELALAAAAVAQQLGLVGAIPAALAGSVLLKGAPLAAAFRASLDALGLRLEPLTAVAEPARGAVKLALQRRLELRS